MTRIRSNDNKYVADFETTTAKQYLIDKCVKVWAWGIKSFNTNTPQLDAYGVGIETFINYTFSDRKNKLIYFHNGSGFDFEFILPYIYKNQKALAIQKFEYVTNSAGKTYRIIISKIFTHNKKGKKIRPKEVSIEFNCSILLLNQSIAKLGKELKISGLKKEEIDYHKIRNYKTKKDITPEELSYLEKDIEIQRLAMLEFLEISKNPRITIGATSYAAWNEQINKKFHFPTKLVPAFKKEEYIHLRQWYHGGYVYVNEDIRNKEIETVSSFDVNSLYPYVMIDRPLPFGYPIKNIKPYMKDVNNTDYFHLIEVKVKHAKVKDKIPPFLGIKKDNDPAFKYEKELHNETLYLTTPTYKLFKEHYTSSIEYEVIRYVFRTRNDLFKEYIDHWMKVKVDNDDNYKRNVAKLYANNIYGKFAEHILKISKRITGVNKESGVLEFEKVEDWMNLSRYLPVGEAITAYAKEILINAIVANKERFLYCDTDSIHINGTLDKIKGLELDDTKIGSWKYEGTAQKGIFKRTKRYALKNIRGIFKDGKEYIHDKVRCAGARNDKLTYEIFRDKIIIKDAKLQKIRINGGVLLLEKDFTFLEQAKDEVKKINKDKTKLKNWLLKFTTWQKHDLRLLNLEQLQTIVKTAIEDNTAFEYADEIVFDVN